jgi:hypothetical protein
MRWLILCLALTGCTTTKYLPCPPPVIEEPTYPVVKPEDGIFVRVQALLAEREMRRSYEAELRAALGKCG